MTSYTMYCDGGSRNTGNQKRGGHVHSYNKSAYAYLILKNGKKFARGTRGYYGETNNRMEIQAVLKGFKDMYDRHLVNVPIRVVSDSRYVDNSINQHWLQGWARRGFQRKKGPLKNADQWRIMNNVLNYFPNVKFNWTKGHSNGKTEDSKGNIYVDHLLNKTMDKMPNKGPQAVHHHKNKMMNTYKRKSAKDTKHDKNFNEKVNKMQKKQQNAPQHAPQQPKQLSIFNQSPSIN